MIIVLACSGFLYTGSPIPAWSTYPFTIVNLCYIILPRIFILSSP